jgi:sensor histidine kinase YesM
VNVSAIRENGSLAIEVRDSGPGFLPGVGHAGIGLANTRARLEQLYGSDHQFQYASLREGGASVRITIPYHQRPQ